MRRWTLIVFGIIGLSPLAVGHAARASAPAVVTVRVPGGGIQPRAALDDHGTLHMLYFRGDPGGGDLYYVTSRDLGETFSPAVRVNSTQSGVIATGTMRGGQMAIGRGGRVHVAWISASRPATARSTRSDSSGTRFEAERDMPTITRDIDAPAIAADAIGHVYVGWHGHANGASGKEETRAVWMRTSADDGETFRPERPAWAEPTGACACCGLEFHASQTGGLFVLYRAAIESIHRDMYLLESRDYGAHFSGSAVQRWDINACPMSSMSFAENGNALFAAWETEGQVYAGGVDRSRASVSSPFSPAKGTLPRKHPRLSVDREGRVLLAWADGAGWAKGGALTYEVFDASGKPMTEAVNAGALPVWSFGAPITTGDGRFVIFY